MNRIIGGLAFVGTLIAVAMLFIYIIDDLGKYWEDYSSFVIMMICCGVIFFLVMAFFERKLSSPKLKNWQDEKKQKPKEKDAKPLEVKPITVPIQNKQTSKKATLCVEPVPASPQFQDISNQTRYEGRNIRVGSRKAIVLLVCISVIVFVSLVAFWFFGSIVPDFKSKGKVKDDHQYTFEVFFIKGKEALSDKNYDMAIECYQKAIEKNPGNPTVHNNIGVAYYLKGDYKLAIQSFKKAIELNPEYAEARQNMVLADKKLKEFEIHIPPIQYPTASIPNPKCKPDECRYYISVGSENTKEAAQRKAKKLLDENGNTYVYEIIVGKKGIYRISVDSYDTKNEADIALKKWKERPNIPSDAWVVVNENVK